MSAAARTTIEAQRQQLFRATAVLHVARLALTSKTTGFDPDECATALAVAAGIVDGVAAALEVPTTRRN
jgi:hypothetical protein